MKKHNFNVQAYLRNEDAKQKQLNESKIQAEQDRKTEFYQNVYSKKHENEIAKQKQLTESVQLSESIQANSITKVLSTIVEKALDGLLDINIYKNLNENYQSFISETISKFVSSDNVNEEVNNQDMVVVLESIQNNLPHQSQFSTLNESFYDQLGDITYDSASEQINKMSVDVMDRVADIIEKSRKETEDTNDNLNMIRTESVKFVKRTLNKNNIVEALMLNEYKSSLSESQDYDFSTAFANAITYITILETLDNSGLVSIGKDGYDKIIKLSANNKLVLESSNYDNELKDKIRQNLTEQRNVDTTAHAVTLNESSSLGETPKMTWGQWKAARNLLKEGATYTNAEGKTVSANEVKNTLLNEGYTAQDIETYNLDYLAAQHGFKK